MKSKLSTTTMIHNNLTDKQSIEVIAKAGFDCYDFNLSNLNIEPEHPLNSEKYMEYLNELKSTADNLGIICNQAHAPFPSQIYGNDEFNQKNFWYIVRSMECASYLGAKIIVVHPIKERKDGHGNLYLNLPSKEFTSSEEKFKANIDFYNKLLPYCKKFKIKVALENLWIRSQLCRECILPSTCGTAEEFVKYLDALDKEWFVGCLDVGHSILCGEKPQDAIRILGKDRLKALHIHDVDYREDTHIAPYMQKIDWNEVLSALKEIGYDGDFTFEAVNLFKGFPNELLPDTMGFLCKIGRYMIRQFQPDLKE